jgi:hypothetical protein
VGFPVTSGSHYASPDAIGRTASETPAGCQYYRSADALAQTRHAEWRPLAAWLGNDRKLIASATPDDDFLALGFFEYLGQSIPGL